MILALVFSLLTIAESAPLPSVTGRVTVDAKSNIFWAGQSGAPPDGLAPVMIPIPQGKNRYFEFTVSGEVDCGLGIKAGPDGGTCGQRTDVHSDMRTGIGGVVHNSRTMFLVGVFLTDERGPGFPPAKFDYSSNARTAVPNHVTFIIGDGLSGTGTGERLRFPVPPAATRLFLGLVDGHAGRTVEGVPGGYANNSGSFDVQYRLAGEEGVDLVEPAFGSGTGPRATGAPPPQPSTTPTTVSATTPAAASPAPITPPPAAAPVGAPMAPRACPANRPVSSWSDCTGVLFDASSGSTYAGDFLNGQYHGVGTLRSRDGVYTGNFIAGRFEGLGVFTMTDGRRYIGQFVAGSMSGLGRLIDAQGGEVFSGQFADGLPLAPAAPAPGPVAPIPARPVTPVAAAPAPRPAPAPVAAPAPTPTPAPAASARRHDIPDGVYLRTQMFNSSLVTEVFQVKGNRIASGPKKLLKDSEFTAENAYKVGTIRTEGDRAIIRWAGADQDSSHSYAKNKECPNFAGGLVCPVATFKPGERVTGTFSGTIGSSLVSQSVRLQLNNDGTYSLKRTGIVNAPSAGGIAEGTETGRYTLANSSLQLQPDGGTPQDYLAFPFPTKEPKWLWFGDRMLDGTVIRGN